MATFDQKLLLTQLEDQVELHLQQVIGRFQNLSEAELNAPSASGGWSMAQCLWHLNSYGHFYHLHISNAVTNARPAPLNGKYGETWLGGKFARMMDPTTGTGRMKAFKAHAPVAHLNGREVVAEFITQQESLLAHLRAARSLDLRSVSIPVSIFQWLRLPLGDVFRFLIAHDKRHVEQALRNLPTLAK